MAVRPLLLVGCTLAALSVGSRALAYCRTHTDDPPASSCPEACKEEGFPLFWAKSQLTYTFNQRSFPGLSEDALRSIIGASFQTWESVTCEDGQSVGLNIEALAGTTSLQEGPKESEPNQNVIAHLTAREWQARDYDPQAYAITAVWFNPKDGEIMGADMLFNGRMDNFGICSNEGCDKDGAQPRTDLRNVATHEIGHFLGLSHSDVDGSTMYCGAAPTEVSKRSLTLDDVAGLCDIYPPGDAFRKDQAITSTGGASRCSLALPGEPGTGLSALASVLLPGLLLARRRRRQARARARQHTL